MAPEESKILTHEKGRSDIVEFYRDKTIFITGGTGFMGKVLIETLLRCCPDIKRIYILCRPKKGKTIEERMAFLLNLPLFDHIKKTKPGVLAKLVVLSGEHTKPNFGMSEEDLNRIVNETNVIFHMAATIRFDEELRQAIAINVRSTKDLLTIARRMNLAAFVHVSTAYANCIHKEIKEQFYEPPIDGDKLIEMVDSLSDDMLLRITPGLLGPYPNTYTFTKCVSEDMIKKYSAGLPITIVRPSIVAPAYNEPCAGWMDSVNGPFGVGIGIGVGILHVLNLTEEHDAELIPVDFATNAIIAAAWNVGTRTLPVTDSLSDNIGEFDQVETKKISANDENSVEIYHSVSSENPISWGTSMRLIAEYAAKNPSCHMIWKPFYITTDNEFFYNIWVWIVHWIPAYIVDTILKLIGKKPMLMKIYLKVEKFRSAQKYFLMNEWTFAAENMRRLVEKVSDSDKEIFPFDVKDIDWDKDLHVSGNGIKKYILKETSDPAYNKLRLFTVAHYTLCALLLFLLFKLFMLLF